MRRLIAFIIRATAFSGMEIAAVVRQPRLIITLVVGPFLILLLFGAGYTEDAAPRRTLFVAAEGNPIRSEIPSFAQSLGPQLVYEGIIADEEQARQRLREGEVDLVVLVPDDPVQKVRNNQHAVFTVLHSEINPLQEEFVRRMGEAYVDEVNRRVQGLVAQEGRNRADSLHQDVIDARNLAIIINGGLQTGPLADRAARLAQEMDFLSNRIQDLQQIEPDILVEPFLTQTESVAPVSPSLADYFAPAVIALLIQHLAVTFAGLSLVRDRRLGAVELFRVAPISAFETLVGKYLAYLALGLIVAAVLTAAVVWGLGVSMLGDPGTVALVIVGLLFASLGVGFVISILAQNENQAVQYSMLVLLTSVFFSGFLVILTAITLPIRYIAWVLPVTYGIKLLRDVMFRGELVQPEYLALLCGVGAGLMLVSWLLLARRMATR